MGFEQLAELRDRLRAEKTQVKPESTKQPKRKPSPQTKLREQDPAVEAIWLLQKHFPLAFPVSPAPKVPLKEGILKDAEQHLELLGITSEQLKLGIATWCRGSRYWASMTESDKAESAYAGQGCRDRCGRDRGLKSLALGTESLTRGDDEAVRRAAGTAFQICPLSTPCSLWRSAETTVSSASGNLVSWDRLL